MATLYEIKECFRDWQNKIIEQEGELTEEDMQAFAELEAQADEKIEAYAVIIKEKKAQKEMYTNEIKRLQEEKQKEERSIERMTKALDEFMQSQGKDKYSSIKAKVGYRKSVAVDIEENANIPNEFLRIKQEADKTAIKQYLEQGGVIQGCQIVERNNIQIR